MNSRHQQIGFSQRIRLEWLEYTANLALAGKTRNEINSDLTLLLMDKLSGGGKSGRGSREKVISILMKCWVSVPKALEPLRNDALVLLNRLSPDEHLVLHWGLAMAVYPFWGIVAEMTGRLLRLQKTVAASQVQRRTRELLGEREAVSQATKRILRTFIDWGVLEKTPDKGVYQQGSKKMITDAQLIAWLIEAVLISSGNNQSPLKAVTNSPSIFPYHLVLPASKVLEECQRLEIVRHGLDEEMMILRNKTN